LYPTPLVAAPTPCVVGASPWTAAQSNTIGHVASCLARAQRLPHAVERRPVCRVTRRQRAGLTVSRALAGSRPFCPRSVKDQLKA